MTSLKELQDALHGAENVQNEVKNAWSKRKYELVRQAEDAAYAEFKDRLNAAYHAVSCAADAELAERDRIARTGEGSPFPVGTKLVEWERYNIHGTWSRKDPEFLVKKTGVVGVVEVVTTDTVHPERVSRRSAEWRNAQVGEFIIRLCKKDGTPGKNYLRFLNDNTRGFRVEGVTPSPEELK